MLVHYDVGHVAVLQVSQEHQEGLEYVVEVGFYAEEQEFPRCLHAEHIVEGDDVIQDETVTENPLLLVSPKEPLEVDRAGQVFLKLRNPQAMGVVVVPHGIPDVVLFC